MKKIIFITLLSSIVLFTNAQVIIIDDDDEKDGTQIEKKEDPTIKNSDDNKYFALGVGVGYNYGGAGLRFEGRFNRIGIGGSIGGFMFSPISVNVYIANNFYLNTSLIFMDYEAPALPFMFGTVWTWGDKVGVGFNAGAGIITYPDSYYNQGLRFAFDIGFILRF